MEPMTNISLLLRPKSVIASILVAQATFSLKDDRDCVNPFIDQSDASHVKGYSGKRVPGSGVDPAGAVGV